MRIRSIRPEFWSSEDIAALDWDTRLLFIGLWSYVDDNGVGRDIDKLVKADLFPLEDDPRDTLATVSRGLQALCDGGQITRYEVDGKPYLHIVAWETHQRVERPGKQRYPLPTCGNAVIRDTLPTLSPQSPDTLPTGEGEKGRRGEGEKGKNLLSDESDEPDRFDEFWDAYDKKDGRKRCVPAYRAALKKPGVTPDLLITAAAEYVAWVRSEGKHPQFTKNPLTWLNGEHWTDERSARATAPTRTQQHLALARQLAAEEQGRPPIGELA